MGMERKEISMLNKFNLMPVKDKKPLVAWTNLIDTPQPFDERLRIIKENHAGNIGVVCGRVSQIFVLDDDGSEELKKYALPRTATVRTPRGGKHYYFKWTSALDNKVTTRTGILDKVDTRGHGGYVVFYGWDLPPTIAPFAEPPQWLVDKLPNKTQGRIIADRPTPVDILRNVSEDNHNRNASFASLAGGLRRDGKSPEYIFEILKPKAKEVNFPEEELWLICKSIGRYAPNQPMGVPNVSNHSFKSFMSTKKSIPFIIPGILGSNTINIVAGLQSARKSWLQLDMAVALASGTLWFNRYPCKQSKVLLIDQERAGDEMKRRIDAIIKGRGLDVDSLEGRLIPKADLDPAFDLKIPESFNAFEKLIADTKPDVTLIDSLKTIQSGNIKDSNDMQPLFEKFKALRRRYNTAFVILHHENNRAFQMIREKEAVTEETIEGSASIKQVPEGLFVARDFDGQSTMLYHVKNSYGPKEAPFLFRVIDVTPDRDIIKVEAQ